jgi:zinc protease
MKLLNRFNRNTLAAALLAPVALLPLAGTVRPQAQAPGQDKSVSRSKVERKNRAPVSKDVLRVKLPTPVEAKLDNGLTVLVLSDHRFPTVTVRLNISGAGPIFEPADMHGLANVTAAMLREGTKTRTSRQIAEEVERLGASLSASSGYGSAAAAMSVSGLSDNFDQWFALFTDVLTNPTFPPEELAKLKTRIKTQLKQARTDPSFLADERFKAAVYGGHPASVVATTPEVLDKLTPEMLAAWHSARYVPQNAFLGIAGDVDATEVIAKLKQSLAGWKRTDFKETFPANPQPTTAKRIYLIDRPNSVQSTITMGNIAIDRRSPDYVPVVVMDNIIGGGASARLFLNLREDKGYTYGVYSGFTALRYPGPWSASGDFRTDVTEGAMTELVRELRRIREERVPADELEEKKRAIVSSFALSLESPSQLLNYAMLRKIYDLPADYWDTYPAKIMAVTAEDVQRVARQYVNPETQQVVVVGDASKIKSILEKFGPVEVLNTEGKTVAEAPKGTTP